MFLKFNQLAYMKVEQGDASAYVDMESKYYKVYHEGLIEAGGMNSWGIYQLIVPFGFGGEYNYIAADGYESLSQRNSITQEQADAAWEKAAAGESDEYIYKLTNETRVMVTSEVWRHIMDVAATE